MRKVLVTIPLGLAAFTFFSCGGGGGSDSSTSTTLTGQFVDAPVAGLDYETSSGITGTTDSNGYFNYREGDIVTFKIGKIVLGDAKGNNVVTPTNLFADETQDTTTLQQKIETVIALLQTLDSDPTDNVITIPEDIKNELSSLPTEVNLEEQDVLNVSVDIDGDGIEENLDTEINENIETAKQHYVDSMYSYLTDALSKIKNFYFQREPDIKCSMSYTGGDTFSFTCNNSSYDDTATIEKNYTDGFVYIVEGNGSKDILLSASPERICILLANEQVEECFIAYEEDNDQTTTGNTVNLAEYLKDQAVYEHVLGEKDGRTEAGNDLRKKYTINGQVWEISFSFDGGKQKADGSYCDPINSPEDAYNPDCYRVKRYTLTEMTTDRYRETYECEYDHDTDTWKEFPDYNLDVPLQMEIGKTYDIGRGDFTILEVLTNYSNPILKVYGNSNPTFDLLKTKFVSNDDGEIKYTWFAKGYGISFDTTGDTIDLQDIMQTEQDWLDSITEYLKLVKSEDGSVAYISYNFTLDSETLDKINNLLNNLPDPFTDVPPECRQVPSR